MSTKPTPPYVADLATMTPPEAARKHDKLASTVYAYAKRHGIAVLNAKHNKGRRARREARIAKVLPRLGTCPDATLAQEAGVGRSCITVRRNAAGIPAFQPNRKPKPIKPPDSGIATSWIARLGKESDPAIAASIGATRDAVAAERRRRKIAPFVSPAASYVDRLGKEPDRAIARSLGIDSAAVRDARIRRSIPPFRPGATPPAASPFHRGPSPAERAAAEAQARKEAAEALRKRHRLHELAPVVRVKVETPKQWPFSVPDCCGIWKRYRLNCRRGVVVEGQEAA